MSYDFFDRRRAERFAQLLDETNGGPRHHTRGARDEQLAELVTVGNTLTRVGPAVRTATVDPEFRSSLRAMLVATAEREGVGVTAQSDPGAEEPASRWRAALGAGAGRRIRARGAIVIGVAVGAVAVSGMSFASEDAVPGDALYGVKRSTEKAQLALAGSDITRGQLFLGFARNRLGEATAVRDGSTDLDSVLADMDADSREGVSLLNTAAVQRRDDAPLDAVDAFVSAQRKGLGPLIDRLDAADRQNAIESLNLLDDVERRVRGLRNGFECGADGVAGADSLGPRPKPCAESNQGATGSDKPDATEQGGTSTKNRVPAEENGPSGRPVSPGTGNRNGVEPSGAGIAPATSAPAQQQDQPGPTATQDKGILDRIFGGLLG